MNFTYCDSFFFWRHCFNKLSQVQKLFGSHKMVRRARFSLQALSFTYVIYFKMIYFKSNKLKLTLSSVILVTEINKVLSSHYYISLPYLNIFNFIEKTDRSTVFSTLVVRVCSCASPQMKCLSTTLKYRLLSSCHPQGRNVCLSRCGLCDWLFAAGNVVQR